MQVLKLRAAETAAKMVELQDQATAVVVLASLANAVKLVRHRIRTSDFVLITFYLYPNWQTLLSIFKYCFIRGCRSNVW